ncbi:MAG: hypothetical protein ABW182_13000 [Sphingomonas sp.]
MTEWLDEQGISWPDTASRFPTGSEIRQVLGALPAEIELIDNGVDGPMSASIFQREDCWASLQIERFTGDDDPQALYFEKGSEELIVEILRRLSVFCGPLVLINDVGDPPEVVFWQYDHPDMRIDD